MNADSGNRRRATGNRQPATGNWTRARKADYRWLAQYRGWPVLGPTGGGLIGTGGWRAGSCCWHWQAQRCRKVDRCGCYRWTRRWRKQQITVGTCTITCVCTCRAAARDWIGSDRWLQGFVWLEDRCLPLLDNCGGWDCSTRDRQDKFATYEPLCIWLLLQTRIGCDVEIFCANFQPGSYLRNPLCATGWIIG